MNKVIACAVALVAIAVAPPSRAFADTAKSGKPLTQFLSEQSKLLGFRYSDEHFDDGKAPYDAINLATDFAQVPPGKFASIADIVAAIRKAVPSVDVSVDSVHSDIVHIADKRLKDISGFTITARIKDFTYKGDLPHLPAAIGSSLNARMVCVNIATDDAVGCAGFNSSISISVSASDVRSVLTAAAYPFHQPNGNLWTTLTRRDKDGNLVTYVAFH